MWGGHSCAPPLTFSVDSVLSVVNAFEIRVNPRKSAVKGFSEIHLDTDSSGFDHPSLPESSPLRRHVLYSLKRANWHQKSSPIHILT